MTEKEFKWSVPDGFNIDIVVKELSEKRGRGISIRDPVEKVYTDRYFDTAKLTLFNSGFGCRLRITDKERLEIKFQPKKKRPGFLVRDEWLLYERDYTPVHPPHFEGKKVRDFFLEEFGFLISGDFIPVILLKSRRKKWIIGYKDSLFELSFDMSEASLLLKDLRVPGKKSTYSFLELELESVSEGQGFEAPFRELGALIGRKLGDSYSINKLERCLSYFKLNKRKDRHLQIKADDPTSVTTEKILTYYFNSAEKNLAGVEIGIDAEYIHDMRVAIRKLRTAVPFFKYTMKSGDFNYLKSNLKWLALSLGNVRDIDVYTGRIRDFVPAGILERNSEIMESIDIAVHRLRDEKRMKLIAVLHSYRFKHFIMRVKGMISAHFQRNDYLSISSVSTIVTARGILKKCADDAVKYSLRMVRNFETATDSSIHKLRIRYKKFRYALEFFSSFFESNELKILKLLSPIQDELGLYVDTFFLTDLTGEVIGRTGEGHSGGSFFILKGISAALEEWKKNQREKIFASVRMLIDSQELSDFLEGLDKLIIRKG